MTIRPSRSKPRTKARLIAAVAAPLLLHTQPALSRPAAPAAAVPAAMTMPHISVTFMGGGSPVILIPGLSSPRAVWDGIAPSLAKTHTVCLVQVNGFAGDAPGANLAPGILDGVVADVHALIASRHLAAPAVIGHSMGGLVGLMLARRYPADVGRLMTVDALPFYGSLFGAEATPAMLEPRAKAMRERIVAQYGHPDQVAAGGQAVAAQLTATPGARAKVAAWAAAADPRVTGQAMYEDLATDLRPDLPKIATPITLVYPVASDAAAGKAEQLYHAAYAGARHVSFVPVTGAAHFVMLDQPAAFTAAVDAFLK